MLVTQLCEVAANNGPEMNVSDNCVRYVAANNASEMNVKAFSHWNPMRIQCALRHSHPMRIGANAHSKWIESTSTQSTSRGGLKW